MCDVDDEEKMFEYVCRAFDNTEESNEKRKNASDILRNFDASESKKRFYEVIAKN